MISVRNMSEMRTDRKKIECSEIREETLSRKKKAKFQILSFILCFFRVYKNLLQKTKHENRIVNPGCAALIPSTCSGQQTLSSLPFSYSLVQHYASTIGHISYGLV
jgi:hypothetical protein